MSKLEKDTSTPFGLRKELISQQNMLRELNREIKENQKELFTVLDDNSENGFAIMLTLHAVRRFLERVSKEIKDEPLRTDLEVVEDYLNENSLTLRELKEKLLPLSLQKFILNNGKMRTRVGNFIYIVIDLKVTTIYHMDSLVDAKCPSEEHY